MLRTFKPGRRSVSLSLCSRVTCWIFCRHAQR